MVEQRQPEAKADTGELYSESSQSGVYFGSYAKIPASAEAFNIPVDRNAALGSHGSSTGRPGLSRAKLENLLSGIDEQLDKYGVEELRDGFFDGSFLPLNPKADKIKKSAALHAAPTGLKGHHPLSIRYFVPAQYTALRHVFLHIFTTRGGIKLLKSFLAVFVAYIVCLIPASRDWLGRYNYMIVISCLINHPGRTVGGQIDGAFLVILGAVSGLGWGSFALWVSTATRPARAGYGGVLATFLIIFTALIAWLRARLIRFYQAVISAGIAICHTCLAGVSQTVSWGKVYDYGIPWLWGQAIALVICILLFPDAGSRSIGIAFSKAIKSVRNGLELPRPRNIQAKRELAWNFVNLTEAARDFRIEFTFSKLKKDDIKQLRNSIQAIIRARMALKTQTILFEVSKDQNSSDTSESSTKTQDACDSTKIPTATTNSTPQLVVALALAKPTSSLLTDIRNGLEILDHVLVELCGNHQTLESSEHSVGSIVSASRSLLESMRQFDKADLGLVTGNQLPESYSECPEAVEVFLFVHPIRQLAETVHSCLSITGNIQGRKPNYRINAPSYNFWKSLNAVNPQVRHDRGGLTAGFFFNSKRQIAVMMNQLQSNCYDPALPQSQIKGEKASTETAGEPSSGSQSADHSKSGTQKFRHSTWLILHYLQGFETRFSLKVVLLTCGLSIPAWLPSTGRWWTVNESWWAIVMVWLMTHPRVGGNFHDLTTRILCGVIGSVWGGLAYGCGHGNPYVMAVFFCIWMLPMTYRYTQSSHPRSGIVGSISFIVVSLSAYSNSKTQGVVHVAWTRGGAIVVGVFAAVVLNWILWPFVARHELRKSLASMLTYIAILYRATISKYIYYDLGEKPSPQDIVWSEMLEGRFREGFVRIRQLTELTRHEIRLRGPFQPLPYSELTDTCERFFDKLVQVREASVYFQPHALYGDQLATSTLMPYRRDAAGTILMTLYVLSGALRDNQPVPRYLPSPAAARKRLLERMAVVENELRRRDILTSITSGLPRERRWADVYQYAYSTALTDVVEQLQKLQSLVISITGETGFDDAMKVKKSV